MVDHPWLAVDTSGEPYTGTVYVAWTAGSPAIYSRDARLLFSRSADGGRTFAKPRTLAHIAHGFPAVPVITVGPRGIIHIVFGVGQGNRNPFNPPFRPLLREVVSSSDGGRTFGSPHLITAQPPFFTLSSRGMSRGMQMVNIAAAATDPRDGTLYVAMDAYRTGTQHTDIVLLRSRNGGASWAPPVRVNGDTGSQADHFQLQLLVTSNGTVYVGYFTLASGRVALYLARSTNHGVGFKPSVRVSRLFNPLLGDSHRDGPSWIGDYQGLAAGPHAVYPFWNDTTTGQMEINFAAIPDST